PDPLLERRADPCKPLRRNLGVDDEIMAPRAHDQRTVEPSGRGLIDAEDLSKEVALGKVVTVPDVGDLRIRVIRRQLREVAFRRAVMAVGHRSAIVFEPPALYVEMLEGRSAS